MTQPLSVRQKTSRDILFKPASRAGRAVSAVRFEDLEGTQRLTMYASLSLLYSSYLNYNQSWAWRHRSAIPALGRLRQEDRKFEHSLGYTESLVLKKEKEEEQKEKKRKKKKKKEKKKKLHHHNFYSFV
jgi:hypothetical protein